MIRQPDIQSAAAMLRAAFSTESAPLAHQKSLNLAAQLHGYKNWAHAKAVLEAPAKVTPTAVTKPETAPKCDTREAELATALEWVCGNYEATLAGQRVRDADECLSHANLLLKKRKSVPPEILASFVPCEVDWVKVLAFGRVTHLKFGDSLRRIYQTDLNGYADVANLVDFEYTDVVTNRMVFEYTCDKGFFTLESLRVHHLLRAQEVEPGLIDLKDGRQLQLRVETKVGFATYSPALGITF